MDAVILAAGKGSRLDGIMPPFHKPLLVVNGVPLIVRTAELALATVVGEVFVVVAPENALPISQVLPADSRIVMVVQRHIGREGPGRSLETGLTRVTTRDALVLLSDNILSEADVRRVVETDALNSIGISRVPMENAERFTRWRPRAEHWVEKIPVTNDDMDGDSLVSCWVGPIKIDVLQMLAAIGDYAKPDGEMPIGPLFNRLLNPELVPVNSVDIGVPEALQ